MYADISARIGRVEKNQELDHDLKRFNFFSGDYILVWGDADEDGFFDGELLDGRRGLVPSNFVEKLEGEELLDFHRQVRLTSGNP